MKGMNLLKMATAKQLTEQHGRRVVQRAADAAARVLSPGRACVLGSNALLAWGDVPPATA